MGRRFLDLDRSIDRPTNQPTEHLGNDPRCTWYLPTVLYVSVLIPGRYQYPRLVNQPNYPIDFFSHMYIAYRQVPTGRYRLPSSAMITVSGRGTLEMYVVFKILSIKETWPLHRYMCTLARLPSRSCGTGRVLGLGDDISCFLGPRGGEGRLCCYE